MPIEIRTALKILADVVGGNFKPVYFQQNKVALNGFNMAPQSFNRKLHSPFTLNDHYKLAVYFELGEEGHKAFAAKDEIEFRNCLRELRVGIYSEEPWRVLYQRLNGLANETNSTLIFERDHGKNTERGLMGPDNATQVKGLTLGVGDSGRIEYRYSLQNSDDYWFALVNVHSASGCIRLLNPIFIESAIQLGNGLVRYPESSALTIEDSEMLGSHTLFALAVTEPLLTEIQQEMSRLLRDVNNSDSRNADNIFSGLLDKATVEKIEKASRSGLLDAAALPYTQVARAQQP